MLCPNEAYGEFIKLYKHAFVTCFPLCTCKINNKALKRELWATTSILIQSIQKAKRFVRKLSKPTADNIAAYEEYNSMFNRFKRATKSIIFKTPLRKIKKIYTKNLVYPKKGYGQTQ